MSQNVVNFSDLNENEQQKYIEFFLQNKFIFTEDQAGESFNATIKINMNQAEAAAQASSSSQNAQNIPQQSSNLQKTINFEQDKQGLISTKENIEQQKQIRSSVGAKLDIKKIQNQSKENCDAISQRKQTAKVNNRYSKSPIQKKIPVQQQQPILSNITNKLSKQQSQQINSSQQLRESLSKTKLTQSTTQDNQQKLFKKPQEQENFEDGQKQTDFLESKKQQILEKLKVKLEEANKLAEYEDQQQQQSFLKQIAPQQSHQNVNKKAEVIQEIRVNDKRRSISNNNIKQQQIHSNNRMNKENNKENNEEDQRSRGISFDLMQKNREFICKLQEKNKQKQQKSQRKSISPAVTARKMQPENTINNINKEEQKLNSSRNGAHRRHSNILISNQRVQTSRGRSNTQENCRSTNLIQNQTQQEKVPSTFEQIMSKQSQLINNVCNLIHDKKKTPQINLKQNNYFKQEETQQTSTSPNRSPSYINSAQNSSKSYSSLQKQTMSSLGKQNNKNQFMQNKQAISSPNDSNPNRYKKQTTQSSQNMQENNQDPNNYFEFNSFGSPNNQYQVNQQNYLATEQFEQRKQAQKNVQQKQDFAQNPKKKLNFEDEDDDEFKLYNIETKRQRKQEQLGSSMQSNRSNQNSRGNNSHKGRISVDHSHISDVSDYTLNHINNNYNQKNILCSKRISNTQQEENQDTQFLLTEIRAYQDHSLALRPTKMTLPQIYKCIEELYQAKFCENTLRMKMSSNGSRKIKQNQGYRSELSMQLGVQPYEISFSEFIYEYYKEKYISSKKVSEQHLINLIVSVEFYIQNHYKYSTNQILPIQTFASFIQNTYQEEELIFYLFVREMLLKYTQESFDSNNKIYETQSIELSLEECQQILEQVYGGNEQKIIDRFMYRLTDILMQQKESNDYNINANFFLNLALQDYIEGKNNKIYESDKQLEQINSQRQQIANEVKQRLGTNEDNLEDDYENLQKNRSNQNLNSMNSFEKWEYTFEQSFGEASHLPSQLLGTNKKFSMFTPKNELEERIWEKMIQKISDFIELVINDNYNEFTIKEKKVKFISVEKIVTKKVNKMMGAIFDQDRERWLELLCITRPSQVQLENLETILNILESLQKKHVDEINNSEISNFCKTILQTKELSKAIGKLLVCVLMPDNQS